MTRCEYCGMRFATKAEKDIHILNAHPWAVKDAYAHTEGLLRRYPLR
jgi:hypothetical protein